jgi:hypothetical protein
VAESAGVAFGALLLPFAVLLIPHLLYRIIRRRWAWDGYFRFYTALWLLFVTTALFKVDSGRETASGSPPQASHSELHRFAPAFSEFSVTFTQQPNIIDIGTSAGATPIQGLRAEVIIANSRSFQRAEVVSAASLSRATTKEQAFAQLKVYADTTGLKYPEYSWEITPLGPKGGVRGTKFITNRDQQIAVTYNTVYYFGHSTMMALYVGCPATSYPTDEIARFLDSIRLNQK